MALRVERLAKAFDRPLFAELTFDILRGEKWGILGPNGSGKTTLLLCLLGRQQPDAGRLVFGAGVRIAYFDQQLADLDEDLPALEAVRPDGREFPEQARRDLLARFGLTGDMAQQRVGSLSGGEQNRVVLARVAASEANFLILDEPTNHLDLWSRGALEAALQKFDGTVLFVSHDRYFLNQVADHLIVAGDGRFRIIDGNYDALLYRLKQEADDATGAADSVAETRGSRPGDKRLPAEKTARRRRKFPYRKLAELEAEIASREQRVEELHADLASPEVCRDGERIKQAMAELDSQQQTLKQLYEHWEESLELN